MKLNPSRLASGLWLCCVALTWSFPAGAAEDLNGDIHFHAAVAEASWVGQQRELQLDLWTNGFSFADQLFVLPEVRGAYLLQPDSTTVKLSEERNGVQWQGLRYTFLLYPQREGFLVIPSFDVSFKARAGFGSEPADFRFSTEPLQIEARMPPGVVPGGLVVTTASFSLESSWAPASVSDGVAELKVGDAITLSVTRQAQDVPGMVFEPLPDIAIDGLGVYPATSQVNDRVNRGSLMGERTDSVTFVCEREGTYRIPEFVFQWWDPDRENLSQQRIDSLELTVVANPAWVSKSESDGGVNKRFGWKSLAAILIAAGALVLAWFTGVPRLKDYLRQRRKTREQSEPWAFRQVRQACGSGNPAGAYQAITLWLSRVDALRPGCTLTELAELSGNEDLNKEATALQERVASGSTEEWRGGKLAQLLVQSREGLNQPLKPAHALRDLNPPSSR